MYIQISHKYLKVVIYLLKNIYLQRTRKEQGNLYMFVCFTCHLYAYLKLIIS